MVQTDTNGVLYLLNTPIEPAAAGVVVKIGAREGFTALLKKHPSSAKYLTLSAGVIDLAIMNQTYDPAQLKASIAKAIGTDDPLATAAISDVLDLYGIFYGQVAAKHITDASPYLGPGLQGVADGITEAVAMNTAPPTQ